MYIIYIYIYIYIYYILYIYIRECQKHFLVLVIWFSWQRKVLKMFYDRAHFGSKDGIVILLDFLVQFQIYSSPQFTILLRLSPGLSTLCDSLRVFLAAEGAKNLSWSQLSLLRGWGSLAMTFLGKLAYIYSTPFICAPIPVPNDDSKGLLLLTIYFLWALRTFAQVVYWTKN